MSENKQKASGKKWVRIFAAWVVATVFIVSVLSACIEEDPTSYIESDEFIEELAERMRQNRKNPSSYEIVRRGNVAFEKGDFSTAANLYRQAAEKDNHLGQLYLGDLYREGKGVLRDYSEAMRWLKMAAEQGSDVAELRIGQMFHEGQGQPPDDVEALEWFRKAAMKGNAKAASEIGDFYKHGEPPDLVKAYAWLNLGASMGDEVAEFYLSQIESDMTVQEVNEAQALSRRLNDETQVKIKDITDITLIIMGIEKKE